MLRMSRLVLIIVAIFAHAVRPARADFTFVHISDIHIGAGENAATDAKMFTEIAALDPRPAFIVNTGDVCENGTDAQYELYRETIKNLGGVLLYNAPGNHDIRWNPRGKEGYVKGVGQPLYQSWDFENVHFVTLDSTVLLEHWGHISQDQLDWLKEDLEKAGSDKPVVIGFHHGVGQPGAMFVDNEQALFDLVKPYNVVLWLQGHGHSDIEWNINGRPATMVAGLYQGSYDIIRVSADEMKITKRFIPKPKKKKGQELLKDKSAPPEEIPPQVRDVVTIPLKKLTAPQWSAKAEPKNSDVEIEATPPAGATVRVQIPTTQMAVAGEHLITVNAELPDKTTYQKYVPVKMPGPVTRPAWSTNIHGAVQSRLVRSGDLLYTSSMGNDLVALNPENGKEKFRAKSGGPIFCEPAVQDGTVYFGSADHFVYAVDALSGKEKWKTETGAGIFAGPAVAKGIVCIGSSDTKIYGLDASTGSQIWTVQGGNMFQTKTATDGERFFVGGWDNHFRCIDAASGKVNWDLELGRKTAAPNFSPFAPAITAPAVGEGKIFISTNDGILHALRTENGEEIWKIDWKNMGYSSPLYRDGRIYCALSDQGRVFCVDANTGEFRWIAETKMVIYDSSFCYGGGNVFIGNVNGTVNCLNADSGRFVYQYRMTPGHLLGSPIADDKFVYVGNMAGRVIALPLNPPPPPAK